MEKPGLLIIHAKARPYRLPLFNTLDEKFRTIFLFTHGQKEKNPPREYARWDYKILKKTPFLGYKGAINPGLIPELIKRRKQYQTILASDIASFPAQISFIMSRVLKKKYLVFSEIWKMPDTFWGKILYPFIKYIAKKSGACVAAGSKSKEFYLKAGAKPDKIFVAPNISQDLSNREISWEKFEKIRSETNPENKRIILYLGRILRIKNLDALITAFSKLEERNDVKLLIVGNGPFENYCHQLAKKLAVNQVYFLNKIPFEDTHYYYKLCYLFVLPGQQVKKSNINVESWGMTLNEAMSMGKPVISTTSVGGSYDLIKNMKNGIQVKEGDPEELYRAILKIVSDDKLAKIMGEESQKIAKYEFCPQKQAEMFVKAIDYANVN
ncbi:MAG: glycosyltransferase family 4 protein [Patescibacteria group bacterium]